MGASSDMPLPDSGKVPLLKALCALPLTTPGMAYCSAKTMAGLYSGNERIQFYPISFRELRCPGKLEPVAVADPGLPHCSMNCELTFFVREELSAFSET